MSPKMQNYEEHALDVRTSDILTSTFKRLRTSYTTGVLNSRHLETREIFVREIKIYFKGLPPSLDENDLNSFEGWTSMYLIGSMVLNAEGYVKSVILDHGGSVRPEFSMTTEIVEHAGDYIVCDFKIVAEELTRSSPGLAETKFEDAIVSSFGDPYFIESYIRVLKTSSAAFQGLKGVSVAGALGQEVSVPVSLQKFQFDDIILEFYGVGMNRIDTDSLTGLTELFLLRNMLKYGIDGTKIERVTLKFFGTDNGEFRKSRFFLRTSIYVQPGHDVQLSDEMFKYIILGIFMHSKNNYMSLVNSLWTGIDSFEIGLLSYSPSLFPSSIPRTVPTLDSTFAPPIDSPSAYPSNLSTRYFTKILNRKSSPNSSDSLSGSPSHPPLSFHSRTPSDFPSFSHSRTPSDFLSFSHSRTPSDFPSFSHSRTPSDLPSFSPSSLPSKLASSAFPSTVPSSLSPDFLLDEKKRTPKIPEKKPVTCQDDGTYRSRYASSCYIYRYVECSRMVEIGFSETEVHELMRRCRSSCNTCLSSSSSISPSAMPSRGKANILSTIPPYILPSNTPSFVPSRFLHTVTTRNFASDDTTIAADLGKLAPEKFNSQMLLIPLIFGFVSIILYAMVIMKQKSENKRAKDISEKLKDMNKSKIKITEKRSSFIEEDDKRSKPMEEDNKRPNSMEENDTSAEFDASINFPVGSDNWNQDRTSSFVDFSVGSLSVQSSESANYDTNYYLKGFGKGLANVLISPFCSNTYPKIAEDTHLIKNEDLNIAGSEKADLVVNSSSDISVTDPLANSDDKNIPLEPSITRNEGSISPILINEMIDTVNSYEVLDGDLKRTRNARMMYKLSLNKANFQANNVT